MAKPPITLGAELIQDLSAVSPPVSGYLRRHRHRIKTLLSDGTRSDAFVVDVIDRADRDAVCVAIWARAPRLEDTLLLLRRQFRYGAYLASGAPSVIELVAGVIERGETPEVTGARELREEAGLLAEPSHLQRLGPPVFALPSILTERIFPLAAEVEPAVLRRATETPSAGDGSPFEDGAEMFVLTLGETKAWMAREGGPDAIADAKTELVLARLERAIENGGR